MPADNLVFSMQTLFSFTTLLFCCIMLGSGKDPSYYLPVLTSIVGYWLPSPRGSATATPSVRSLPTLFMKREISGARDLSDEQDRMERGLTGPPDAPSPQAPSTAQSSHQSHSDAQSSHQSHSEHPVPDTKPKALDKGQLPMRLVKFETRVPR